MTTTFSINTRYNSPTNTKGARITAYITSGCANKSISVAYNYALNSKDNHIEAANKLAKKLFDIDGCCLQCGETRKGYKYIGYIFA